jgi:Patatin phospholipase
LWSTEADFAFLSNRQYPFASDGGLFDNTPLSQLLNQVSVDDAPATRVIVINLFPNRGSIPKNIINVWDRMIEIQFSNKTKKDVALAQKINKLIAAIGRLQGLPVHHADSLTQLPEFADLAKYKVFDNIIAITNDTPEEVSSSADFSKASIDRRIATGYHDAKIALTEPPRRAANTQPINPNRMTVFKLANISTIASVSLLLALFCKQIDYMLSVIGHTS